MQRRKLMAKTNTLAFPPHEYQDVMAIKAVYAGSATDGQQRRAMNWIIKHAADIGGDGYDPDCESAIVRHSGRRFVGRVLLALIEEPREALKARFPASPLGDLPQNPADLKPDEGEDNAG